ncbi:hypothetical protein ABEW19_24590 [Paenibacillus illinoisensis]|uniref:hypothetical protein n=1 Tax=Paenibacillus illinoisensis TaxID=59845 RepID=UPI003D2E9739
MGYIDTRMAYRYNEVTCFKNEIDDEMKYAGGSFPQRIDFFGSDSDLTDGWKSLES